MTEERALARLKKKDPAALSFFIERYTPYVSTVVWNILSRRMAVQDAEEVCSDVFVALWENAEKVREDKVKSWLGVIARNRAIDRLRRQGFDVELEDDILVTAEDTPERIVERKERDRRVREAVWSLKQPDRDIFIRFYYYCQRTEDIAAAMKLSPSAVRQRLRRGRERLRTALGGYLDEISNF